MMHILLFGIILNFTFFQYNIYVAFITYLMHICTGQKMANFWLMKIDYNDDLILPPSNSLEENARIWAEYFCNLPEKLERLKI